MIQVKVFVFVSGDCSPIYSIGSVFCGGVQWVTIHEGMTRYPFVLTKRDCMMILCHC